MRTIKASLIAMKARPSERKSYRRVYDDTLRKEGVEDRIKGDVVGRSVMEYIFERGRDPEGTETIVFIRINSCRPRVETGRCLARFKGRPRSGRDKLTRCC